MERRRGRPKGPQKVRFTISLSEPAAEYLTSKAGAKKLHPATYLARQVEQQAENAQKTVATNFKGSKK